MRLAKRLGTMIAAAALLAGGATVGAQAQEVDMYTNPGGHTNDGRLWQTDCANYSSTVVRCTTKIWATVIRYQNGAFRQITDWHFNNLTYLPSPRESWKGNPLGNKSDSFMSAGREWRTECDTPKTGRGACRSYVRTDYVARETGKYVNKNGFVFNNLVLFAQGSVKHVKSVPPHVLDQVRLDFTGLGPLKPSVSDDDLVRLGYLEPTGDVCDAMRETKALTSRGINVTFGAGDVHLTSPRILTADGARVGMTMGQVKAIYGSRFKVEAKENFGEVNYFGSVREGDRELVFRVLGGADGHGGFNYAPGGGRWSTRTSSFEITSGAYTDDILGRLLAPFPENRTVFVFSLSSRKKRTLFDFLEMTPA